MSVGGGHQSVGTELVATDGQPTTVLTFPLAEGADVLITFRALLRAQKSGERFVRAYLATLIATRLTGQAGTLSGTLLLDLVARSGTTDLTVSATFDTEVVSSGVATVTLTPTLDAGTPTAITLQCIFDPLPTGAVVK